MVIEKAKRLVEHKKDVVILLTQSQGLAELQRCYTKLRKSFNWRCRCNTLQRPKGFGAARNVEEGGSLTIISTALIDTGSRMDEVIFEEFKGTGNSELILDRKVADKKSTLLLI